MTCLELEVEQPWFLTWAVGRIKWPWTWRKIKVETVFWKKKSGVGFCYQTLNLGDQDHLDMNIEHGTLSKFPQVSVHLQTDLWWGLATAPISQSWCKEEIHVFKTVWCLESSKELQKLLSAYPLSNSTKPPRFPTPRQGCVLWSGDSCRKLTQQLREAHNQDIFFTSDAWPNKAYS